MVGDDMYYISIDKATKIITGISSSELTTSNDMVIEVDEISDELINNYSFYRYENEQFTYDESLKVEYLKAKSEFLSDVQKLGQENTELRINILEIIQALNPGVRAISADDSFVKSLYLKYKNKWCTDLQLERLAELGVLTESDIINIKNMEV